MIESRVEFFRFLFGLSGLMIFVSGSKAGDGYQL